MHYTPSLIPRPIQVCNIEKLGWTWVRGYYAPLHSSANFLVCQDVNNTRLIFMISAYRRAKIERAQHNILYSTDLLDLKRLSKESIA